MLRFKYTEIQGKHYGIEDKYKVLSWYQVHIENENSNDNICLLGYLYKVRVMDKILSDKEFILYITKANPESNPDRMHIREGRHHASLALLIERVRPHPADLEFERKTQIYSTQHRKIDLQKEREA